MLISKMRFTSPRNGWWRRHLEKVLRYVTIIKSVHLKNFVENWPSINPEKNLDSEKIAKFKKI